MVVNMAAVHQCGQGPDRGAAESLMGIHPWGRPEYTRSRRHCESFRRYFLEALVRGVSGELGGLLIKVRHPNAAAVTAFQQQLGLGLELQPAGVTEHRG